MSDVRPVNLNPSGPPSTVLDLEPPAALLALQSALARPAQDRRAAIAAVVAAYPRFLDGWARLGQHARDDIEAYAYFRIGYHRGLDRLRANGWRGSGYVKWSEESNRGFLRALRGLRDSAGRIGENDEYERCGLFLLQLDPTGVPDEG
jgi:hypothetical protein